MRLTLFIDLEGRRLVGGLNDPSSAILPELMQGDTVDVILQGVARNDDTALQYYSAVPISFAVIKCALTSGADVAPTDGTIRLALVGGADEDVTPAFAPGITKPALEALLNALPGVTAKGGVKVLTNNAATNIFRVRWNSRTETATFEFREDLLEPPSDTRSYVVPLPNGQMQLLKYRQLPIAFTDQFSLPVAPVVTTASVRTGTNTRNCIQSITVPRTALGSVHFTFAGLSTPILPVTTLTASVIAGALNNLYADGATRFSVTPASSTVFYVEFVGSLALTDYPVLDATMHDQVFIETPAARLPLNGPTLEMAFDGTAKIDRVLEIEITDVDGEVGTPIQTAVSLRNDVIDGGMSVLSDPNWQVPADPSYPPYDPEGATIIAQPGYVTPIGSGVGSGTAGTAFVIAHNLHTQNCLIEVRETGGTRHRLPDDQYVATYVNDDQIRVDFSFPPTDGQYEVIIAAVKPADMALPHHTHPISDIIDLEEELENLGSEGTTAPLPESRLPAHIGWKNDAGEYRFDEVPDELLPDDVPRLVEPAGTLPPETMPPGVPFYSAGPPPTVSITLPGAQPGDPPQTIVLLQGDTSTNPPTWTLPVAMLPTDPSTWPGLITAIITALEQGATASNLVAIKIDDIEQAFPEPFALASHCPNDTTVQTVPASIMPAIFNPAASGSLSDGLPPPAKAGVAGKKFTVAGSAVSSSDIYRNRQTFRDGQTIVSNGYHWYAADVQANTAYPLEYNRELFSFFISEDMLTPGTLFSLDFTLQTRFTSPDLVRAQYLLQVQLGTLAAATGPGIGANLNGVTWYDPVISELLVLSSSTVFHHFGYAVSRPALVDGVAPAITAKKTLYANSGLAADAPLAASFALRATLSRFDVENSVPNPTGQITLKMAGATARVVKATS